MLEFRNVTKRYPDGNISLDNISFNIDDGEFVFIVGSSGAGKSTIVRLILNIEKPTEGEVYFNNINVSKLKGRKLAYLRREIGVVFQDFKLLRQRTVYENVAFVLEVAHEKKMNVKKKVSDVLDLVGLLDKSNKFPDELSGGEQQRVAIARALVNDPLLLIADEPTGNLDADNAWDTFQLINKVNNWGTSVLVVTHDNEIVDSLQKRVIKLEKGRMIRDSIGGYHHEIHNAKDQYINHQDKFPDYNEKSGKIETLEEFRNRKSKEQEDFAPLEDLSTKKVHELQEIYSDFSYKAKYGKYQEKKEGEKRQKKDKNKKNSNSEGIDDNE